MDKNQRLCGTSVWGLAGMSLSGVARQLVAVALLCIAASANAQQLPNADQLLVTGANMNGNQVFYLGITPSSTAPGTPVIASSATLINSTADASSHGSFDALAWVPNSVCNSLDLIVADASKGQIVRYQGASPVGLGPVAGCYQPSNGTPAVSQTAQSIFKWTKLGAGPAQPNGLSADISGNVFVVSSSGGWDPKPSVWVLPFNQSANQYCKSTAAGAYCAPVLVDNKFGGQLTLSLAETLVASTSALTSSKTTLWKAGDLLVLVGDSFDARLTVYAQSTLYNKQGQLNLGALPLTQPTSTPIPWLKFLAELAAPFGMDLCPGNTTLCPNASVLFTTIDGRILSFDTVQNKFVTDIADRRGLGLQKIKVGGYANNSYAFVAQLEANNGGQILEFGPPPRSGPANNNPLATVSKIAGSSTGIRNPMGLAVAYSGSSSLPTVSKGSPCVSPNPPCIVAPLGPELVSTITGGAGDTLSGAVVEQNCIVQPDPRVTVSGATWSCSGVDLPIGAGTTICPSFPAAVIPGSVCGHSGPTESAFAVIEGTATGIDPNDNNSFIITAGNIDAVLPGANNLECASFATTGQIPLIAWGTRSDLTTVEGTIPEDTQFANPLPLGGQAGYLTELTGGCDTSTTGSRGISIFAIGLGLSNSSPAYVYELQNQKYQALEQTVGSAAITSTFVQTTLSEDIAVAENYVLAAQSSSSQTDFTNNIDCALNEIVTADSYVRGNLPAFSSNLVTMAPGGGNPNPAGDIDGRLANWYTVLNTMLAGNPPYTSWQPSHVPTCAIKQPEITAFFTNKPTASSHPNWTNWTTINATSCILTDLYAFTIEGYGYTSTVSTAGPTEIDYGVDDSNQPIFAPPQSYPGYGTDTYTLTCFGAQGTTPATQSLLVGTSAPPPAMPANTQLTISSFTAELDQYGNDDGLLDWATNVSSEGTYCTITDAYGNVNSGLPASSAFFEGPFAYYPFCSIVPPGSGQEPADTITLTCSDPTYGSAMSTLTLTNPEGYNAAVCGD